MRSFYFPFFSLNLEMWKITSGIKEMIPFGGESLRKGLFPAKKMTQVFRISISAGTVRKESFFLTGTQVYHPHLSVYSRRLQSHFCALLLTDTELAPNSNLSPIRYFRSFLKWILLAFIVSGYFYAKSFHSKVSGVLFVFLKLWKNTGLFDYLFIRLFKLLTVRIYFYKTVH